MNFSIYDSNRIIGEIEKKFFALSDTFVIKVSDPSYEEELVALLIALDDIKDRDR